MTANLLTLNSSKTEFLLIGLKNNLLKYITLLLTPLTLFVSLASFLTNISHSLTKSLHSLNLVILTFVNFAASVLILIPEQPVSFMRVDLSPRLGGHTVANQPPLTTVLLSFTFIPPAERCNHSSLTAGVEQSHELNLNLRSTLL